jgi:glucose-1-phosphate adenylyltransferase
VIVDQLNKIAPGDRIGFDARADAARFHVTPGGTVVVPRMPQDVLPDHHLHRYF